MHKKRPNSAREAQNDEVIEKLLLNGEIRVDHLQNIESILGRK